MLTYVYAKLGDLDDAERAATRAGNIVFEDGLQESSSNAELLANRSKLRVEQGRFEDARTDLRASAELWTRLGNAFFVAALCTTRRAEVELRAGNFREGIAIAQGLLASEHASEHLMIRTEALGFLACLRLHLGEVDAAADAAREQLELAPADETLAIEYLATAAALRGRAEPAAQLKGFVAALVARLPLLGVAHQRTDQLLAQSLREQLPADAIAAQAALGAKFTLGQATSAALRAGTA
jgi:tetratricopeptide (TPR) repeat protein